MTHGGSHTTPSRELKKKGLTQSPPNPAIANLPRSQSFNAPDRPQQQLKARAFKKEQQAAGKFGGGKAGATIPSRDQPQEQLQAFRETKRQQRLEQGTIVNDPKILALQNEGFDKPSTTGLPNLIPPSLSQSSFNNLPDLQKKKQDIETQQLASPVSQADILAMTQQPQYDVNTLTGALKQDFADFKADPSGQLKEVFNLQNLGLALGASSFAEGLGTGKKLVFDPLINGWRSRTAKEIALDSIKLIDLPPNKLSWLNLNLINQAKKIGGFVWSPLKKVLMEQVLARWPTIAAGAVINYSANALSGNFEDKLHKLADKAIIKAEGVDDQEAVTWLKNWKVQISEMQDEVDSTGFFLTNVPSYKAFSARSKTNPLTRKLSEVQNRLNAKVGEMKRNKTKLTNYKEQIEVAKKEQLKVIDDRYDNIKLGIEASKEGTDDQDLKNKYDVKIKQSEQLRIAEKRVVEKAASNETLATIAKLNAITELEISEQEELNDGFFASLSELF